MSKLLAKILPFICTFFFFSITTSFSQAEYQSPTQSPSIISGKVLDAVTGEVLAGAIIKLEGRGISTVANLEGAYIFKQLKTGRYELSVSFEGYNTLSHVFMDLKADDHQQMNLELTPKSSDLATVSVISRTSDETDQHASQLEKNAAPIVNILSAQSIQLLPDLTVGNSLQRISGVTVQKTSSGEARHAIIRGMDVRYNNTTINGIQISSPDPRYSSLPLDIFPSEILERLEVIKTGIASMEGNFVGGSVNMVMRSAPDQFTFRVNASTGLSTLFSSSRPFQSFSHGAVNQRAPAEIFGNSYVATQNDFSRANLNFMNRHRPVNATAGLIIGGRSRDKKLGVLFSGAFQNIYRGDNYLFLLPNAQPAVVTDKDGSVLNNQSVISDILQRRYSTQTARWAIHNKIDYAVNKKNFLTLYNMYVHMDEFESRQTFDSVYLNHLSDQLMRSRSLRQTVYSTTLTGDHLLSEVFSINWVGSYSRALGAQPDWAEYDYQAGGGKAPYAQSMSRQWQHNKSHDESGYLNLYYLPKMQNGHAKLSVGGMYRRRTKDNFELDYNLDPILINNLPEPWLSFNETNYQFKTSSNNTGTAATALKGSNTYTAHEQVAAGYIQLDIDLLKNLQFISGVRIEHTAQDYATEMSAIADGKYGSVNYTDLLPSGTLKYSINQQQVLRASYFRSIIRPEFYELVPSEDIGETFNVLGNDSLRHTRADNYDLKYAWFGSGSDQISLGAFYKSIYDPIEYGVTRKGPSAQFFMPQNFGTAHNYGIEAVFTKFVGMFGLSLNYTYTNSKITTAKLYMHYDPKDGVTPIIMDQTRPLQGQSPHIGNASLIYRNPHNGLDIQVAFSYAGARITQVSPYFELDYWRAAQYNVGFSFEKKFGKHFSWYGKFNNLTNTPIRTFIKQAPAQSSTVTLPDQVYTDKTVVGRELYGLEIQTGVRFKL